MKKILIDREPYRSAYDTWLKRHNSKIIIKRRMNKILNFGSGYRTYLSAVLMVVWAVYGLQAGLIDSTMAQLIVIEALAVFGLRKAIK